MMVLSVQIFDIFIAGLDSVMEFISHLMKSIEFVFHVVHFYFARELFSRDVILRFLYTDLRLDLLYCRPIISGLIFLVHHRGV